MPKLRVRTGCQTCRQRKKKCDERRPACKACERNQLDCHWSTSNHVDRRKKRSASPSLTKSSGRSQLEENDSRYRLGYRQDAETAVAKLVELQDDLARLDQYPVDCVSAVVQIASPPSTPNVNIAYNEVVSNQLTLSFHEAWETGKTGQSSDWADCDEQHMSESSLSEADDLPPDQCLSGFEKVTRCPSQFPTLQAESSDLLDHYLAVTSKCMDNGIQAKNSFIIELVPMAFTSDLILHLLLTHSAVHRAAKQSSGFQDLAAAHYSQSVRLLRRSIERYHGNKPIHRVSLATGTLIMCFVECANGDVNGTVFDHLIAARWLLPMALARPQHGGNTMTRKLQMFLVEYYVYASTMSSISVDHCASQNILLPKEIETFAKEMAADGYTGGLCGCWMELLLIIPEIVTFARRSIHIAGEHHVEPKRLNADEVMMFASLCSRIEAWTPPINASQEYILAGKLYQQAVLLYLHTALQPLQPADNGAYTTIIQRSVVKALGYLAEISPGARVSTNLCWPIAVVGSCVVDPQQKGFIRRRLADMFESLGLGNIWKAATLMDLIWESSDMSPWKICRIMQEKEVWILFA